MQGRKESGLAVGVGDSGQGRFDHAGVGAEWSRSVHDGDRTTKRVCKSALGSFSERIGDVCTQLGEAHDLGGLGVRSESAHSRPDLDQGGLVVFGCVTQTQEECAVGFLRVSAEDHDGPARCAGLCDGCPRQSKDQAGVETVAQLRVDVVGTDDRLRELGPGVLGLVRHASATDDGDTIGVGVLESLGGLRERHRPGSGHQLIAIVSGRSEAVASYQRRGHASIGVPRFEVEAFLVGEPTPVHSVAVDAEVPKHFVA